MPVEGHNGLKGRICLVTGASRGIGAAVARAVAVEGAGVAVNYFSSEREALLLVDELKALGVPALAVQGDVGSEADVEAIFKNIETELGQVDMLINNAGISLRALVTETSTAQWQKVMDTNLKGAFLCCRRALPHMIRQQFGRIVNIASIWGINGAACEAIYAASKGGLISLTKSLAKEVGPLGINVNAVSPGPVETDMLRKELDNEERNNLVTEIPAGRLGYPEEVASACVYLLSRHSSYINGQVLVLDGGWKI
ncbi:MAG: 3-oxoacyl-ACP reductase FabG [Syntrophomonadaceae bacterium]|nr:3-oxoacyl-ACP reductase FabG [Syntrophomonadaceae bacterium]